METLLIVLISLLVAFCAVYYWLKGSEQRAFDQLDALYHRRFPGRPMDAPEQRQILDVLERARPLLKLPLRQQLSALRSFLDAMFASHEFNVEFRSVAGPVSGEWVIASGADPTRRTLYIHGGAFTMGSPQSHRVLTANFARLTGGVVFAVDYRLMPESWRSTGIEDCRAAYRWLLEHGPDGVLPLQALFVGGDSAGGNLTLSTIAWARDSGLRAADAAIALSPLTDATLAAPSFKRNLGTDPMLAPMFGKIARLPLMLRPFVGWGMSQQRPCKPAVSPLHGDLTHLPPVLIQASESEMLIDDCQRYVAKAVAAGTRAELQSWQNMVHVWQMFDEYLPEAREALDEIGRFIDRHAPRHPS